MSSTPRVAFFPDSFYEVNGVARTCRMLESLAQRNGFPWLTVFCGDKRLTRSETASRLQLHRGRWSFAVETDLRFDPRLWRFAETVRAEIERFQPDLIHITGPSDIGQLGAYLAHSLQIPLVASWHTNLHEYAGTRLAHKLSWLPAAVRSPLAGLAQQGALQATMRFYQLARVILCPNEELVQLAAGMTGKPVFLMRRGIDLEIFTPRRRFRRDQTVRIGYVGRLSTEKNVRLLAEIEAGLVRAGISDYQFFIVGEGRERRWLESRLTQAHFTGVLHGEAVAQAYADLDVFVFPSRTDTFGNAVLEALAAGVPAVVTSEGGPKFMIESGRNGFVAATDREFIERVVNLAANPVLRNELGQVARHDAAAYSWDAVFQNLYEAYRTCLTQPGSVPHPEKPLPVSIPQHS